VRAADHVQTQQIQQHLTIEMRRLFDCPMAVRLIATIGRLTIEKPSLSPNVFS
jgi:hypothetical protein